MAAKTEQSDPGMRATGTIESIALHQIPSKLQGRPPETVARIKLRIERAEDARGAGVDTSNLVGLAFQGPADLVSQFKAGERVELITTTPSGMHIASVRRAPMN